MNTPIGNQFHSKFQRAVKVRRKRIAEIAGKRVREEMFANVDKGTDFAGTPFKGYAPRTIQERRKGGFQTGLVDFQRTLRRIKDALVVWKNNAAEIFWNPTPARKGYKYTIGQVFFFHQHGLGNNPERNIFPKNPSDIKQAVHDDIHKAVREVLDEPID
jgi:hypothetical protein